MKNFKLKMIALMVVGFAGFACADQYDLTFKGVKELAATTAAPATGDLDIRYVAADNKVESISSTANSLAGAFNGTVGATTPSTGAFTTLTASSTLTGAAGSTLVSKTSTSSVDIAPPFDNRILGNPVLKVVYGSCTVAAVNAGTCIPLAAVASRTITVTGFDIVAAGSAATCTGVLLEDTNGSPVVIATLAAATLTNGAHNVPLAATLGVGFGAGSGLTAAKGVQIIVNGSGCTTTTAFQYEITYAVQ